MVAAAALVPGARSVTGQLLGASDSAVRTGTAGTSAVGAAAAAAVPAGTPAVQAAAAAVAPACPPLMFFGIRGSGENGKNYGNGYGQVIRSFKNNLHDLVPGMGAEPIKYTAIAVNPLDPLYRTNYDNSVSSGVATAMTDFVSFESTCPQTPIVIAGYSQGVDVAYQVSSLLPEAAQARVIIVGFGDPHFNPDQSWADAGNYFPAFRGILEAPRPLGWGELPHTWLESYAPHLRSWCLHGDDICNYTGLRVATCLVSCTHETGYIGSGYTRDAAIWAYDQWKKRPTPSPTSSTTPSTPTLTPSSSDTSTGPWTASQAPLPSGANGLTLTGIDHVACASASFCVAVGDYDVSELQYEGVIDTFNGSSWSAMSAPLPPQVTDTAAADSMLGSVSCTSPTSCIAVGSYSVLNQNVSGALIETLDNGIWTATTAPAPTGGSGEGLGSVSCASASFCVAVGQYSDSGAQNLGLIETLDNGGWTASEAPAPAGGSSVPLLSVSCGAVGFCAAVNEFNAAIDTVSDGTWTATNPPLPANAGGQGEGLNSVACPSAGSCVAVGSYLIGEQRQGLFEDLSNGAWTVTQAPLPGDASTTDSAQFNSVTCSNAQSCQAVGIYNEPVDPDWGEGVIDTLTNGSWAAAGSESNADFNAAACAGTTCVAAGYYAAETGGLIDTGSHGGWTATEPSLPANASTTNSPEANLQSVSCVTSGFCAAVGWYDDSTGTEEGLIETN